MKDKAKHIAAQAKQRWQAAPMYQVLLLAGCVLTVVVAAAVIAGVMANCPYTELFTDLNQSHQVAILSSYFSDNVITNLPGYRG
ncbi:MAG: hypothetical protein V8R55_14045 [Dysosmobacter sp.]